MVELNGLEKELFSKVETIDYYTTVLKIKGFDHFPMGFYYFGEFMEDPATIGNPVAMQRFYGDTDVFLFWSYGDAVNIQGQTVTKLVIDAVESMGGVVEKIVLQRRFKYFPHVNAEGMFTMLAFSLSYISMFPVSFTLITLSFSFSDMKNGFYDKLESELQGFQNTYYVGGLMAFELTERNSSYSIAMICKHFANDDVVPEFPYVKVNLIPFLFSRMHKAT